MIDAVFLGHVGIPDASVKAQSPARVGFSGVAALFYRDSSDSSADASSCTTHVVRPLALRPAIPLD